MDETSVEEGSWEGDPAAEVEVARLPRPRPDRVTASADDVELAADDAPLDLVAGAPVAAPELPRSDLVAAGAPASGSVAKHIPAEDQPILPAAATAPAPELVASGACLRADAVADKDGDFKRNADALSGSAFCIEEETFKERRRNWTLQTVKTNRPGPLWAVMHDDEDMSFDNAVEALKTYGGTLVTVDTGGKRNMDGIDPNRNFSADGIGCCKLGDDAAPRYTAFFRDLITDEPIIALHNNYDGEGPDRRARPRLDGKRAEGHAGHPPPPIRKARSPASAIWCCSPRSSPLRPPPKAAPRRSPPRASTR